MGKKTSLHPYLQVKFIAFDEAIQHQPKMYIFYTNKYGCKLVSLKYACKEYCLLTYGNTSNLITNT